MTLKRPRTESKSNFFLRSKIMSNCQTPLYTNIVEQIILVCQHFIKSWWHTGISSGAGATAPSLNPTDSQKFARMVLGCLLALYSPLTDVLCSHLHGRPSKDQSTKIDVQWIKVKHDYGMAHKWTISRRRYQRFNIIN